MVRSKAFTLIELLVCITVIAILIALVTPGLDRVRERGLLTTSLSNAHQVALAGGAYQQDFKDRLPFTPVYRRGAVPGPGSGPLEGLCPWSFCGSNNAATWAGLPFDIEAADRPMNDYIASGLVLDAPAPPQTMAAGDSARKLVIPLVRTRGFEDSLEHTFPAAPAPTSGVSCYEDVGTSYLLNLRWLDTFAATGDAAEQVRRGLPALTSALGRIRTDHFAWFTDQTGEAFPRVTALPFEWNNAFDDDDQSVMGFVDGHAAYAKIEAGKTSGKDFTLLLTP
ncbi:MAG: type II secretion system protein [Phycisphaerales bacterium]|jgi:prepilin-type N-terminal cleavage/methylation domain-containing protein